MGTRRRDLGRFFALTTAATLLLMAAGPVMSARAASVAIKVNFQSETAPVPGGYVRDYGQAFDATRGYGWVEETTSVPKSMIGRGRDRNQVTDQRLDTLIHMQDTYTVEQPGPQFNPGRWEHVVPNGEYDVTFSVGDSDATDSNHRIVIENQVALASFVPTDSVKFKAVTYHITVTDGRLTLDAKGGTNTKLNYVQIVSAPTPRRVVGVSPANAATNVSLLTSVTLSLSHPIDNSDAVLHALQVVTPGGAVVSGTYNGDAAGSLISFTPGSLLRVSTEYTVRTTSALVDATGVAFAPFTSSFTTTSQALPPSNIKFTRTKIADMTTPTVVMIGPDGNLWVATMLGLIRRYNLDASGKPTGVFQDFKTFTYPNQRTILGLKFDPRSTTSNPMLWVSNGDPRFDNVPNFTGRISLLTGANLTTKRDVITGLPRSVKDHMTNGITFGPDGKLYIAQGSVTGYGAPDEYWGNRAETPMSAAILVADVVNDTRFASTVNVNTDAGYNPAATNAPVKVYASGIRNPYDLVWHTNGSLYAPVNESGSGNTPAGPNNNPPALTGLLPGRDFLARVLSGRYYGHPNPSIGKFVLNGGNPTSSVDPYETPQYPVGTLPDRQWHSPVLDFGLNRSADGITEYRATAFSDALRSNLLVVEFSGGDDILAIKLNADGTVASKQQIFGGLYNPIDITSHDSSGKLYVAEFGDGSTGAGGKITLLTPAS